ncbi:hypothetical protein PG994_005730 [Apiospora phragmitis]|uniref:Uncharacterized protein n=1 Tax=Apiospora phragmitis TaxID=2905665 RepID=A0ABR1VD18_9PEZI
MLSQPQAQHHSCRHPTQPSPEQGCTRYQDCVRRVAGTQDAGTAAGWIAKAGAVDGAAPVAGRHLGEAVGTREEAAVAAGLDLLAGVEEMLEPGVLVDLVVSTASVAGEEEAVAAMVVVVVAAALHPAMAGEA